MTELDFDPTTVNATEHYRLQLERERQITNAQFGVIVGATVAFLALLLWRMVAE